MGDKNDPAKSPEDNGKAHKDDVPKNVLEVLRSFEKLKTGEKSKQGTSTSTRVVVDRSRWTSADRKDIINEAVKQQKRFDILNTYFEAVENVEGRNLECTEHNSNAIWECLYKKSNSAPVKIVRLCFLCTPVYSVAQEKWSEHMKTVIPIMRKTHLAKIYRNDFQPDVANVNWNDKQSLRIAFGFEIMSRNNPAHSEIVRMAVYDELAQELSNDKGVIPLLGKYHAKLRFRAWAGGCFDFTLESDRMNWAVGIIMNRLDCFTEEMRDDFHIRARMFWENVMANMTPDAANVIVFTEKNQSDEDTPEAQIKLIEYLGVARAELLETGSFKLKENPLDIF